MIITIAGTQRQNQTRLSSLQIVDALNGHDSGSVATMRVRGFTPSVGDDVQLYLGLSAVNPFFGGTVTRKDQVIDGKAANVAYDLTVQDYVYLLNRRLVFKSYTSQSASTIAADLISTYTTGFTTTNVEAALASVAVSFAGVTVAEALSQLAERVGGGCRWFIDPNKDLYFFSTDTRSQPATVTATNVKDFVATTDLSRVITRALVAGHASRVGADVVAGDTAIPVVDPGLFNSAGGEALSGSQRITYTGARDEEVHSPTWTSQTIPNHTWSSVAWSPALALFCAVGSSAVATSPDGITWTDRTAAAAMVWNHVVWAPGLGLFVAVASGAVAAQQVMTSPDGITWTARTASAAQNWRQVVWSPSLSLLVAVSTDGANRVMTSPDGITWTGRTAASASTWWAIAWSPDLSLFVALSTAGAAMSSPDGITWTTRTAAAANQWVSVVWAPSLSLFAAVSFDGASRVMTSPDGVTWTSRSAAAANGWWTVTWSPQQRLFVAVALTGASRIMYSADGTTWTSETAALAGSPTVGGITWSPQLSRYVMVQDGNACQSNDTAAFVALLTGVPASGAGSIVTDIPEGDAISIFKQRDDGSAQTALATLEGGDGIHEVLIVNRDAQSDAELTTIGDGYLALHKSAEVRASFLSRDTKFASGVTATINIGSPTSVAVNLTVQQVTIAGFDESPSTVLTPWRRIEAAPTRFTLNDLLALIPKKAA